MKINPKAYVLFGIPLVALLVGLSFLIGPPFATALTWIVLAIAYLALGVGWGWALFTIYREALRPGGEWMDAAFGVFILGAGGILMALFGTLLWKFMIPAFTGAPVDWS